MTVQIVFVKFSISRWNYLDTLLSICHEIGFLKFSKVEWNQDGQMELWRTQDIMLWYSVPRKDLQRSCMRFFVFFYAKGNWIKKLEAIAIISIQFGNQHNVESRWFGCRKDVARIRTLQHVHCFVILCRHPDYESCCCSNADVSLGSSQCSSALCHYCTNKLCFWLCLVVFFSERVKWKELPVWLSVNKSLRCVIVPEWTVAQMDNLEATTAWSPWSNHLRNKNLMEKWHKNTGSKIDVCSWKCPICWPDFFVGEGVQHFWASPD